MPTIQSVKERREVVSIPWGSDVLHVTYHLGDAERLTPADVTEWQAKVEELGQTGDENAARALTAEMVCRVARDWDLYEDDAQTVKYPLDVEHVAALDFELNASIILGVVLDMREKKENGTLLRVRSGATS